MSDGIFINIDFLTENYSDALTIRHTDCWEVESDGVIGKGQTLEEALCRAAVQVEEIRLAKEAAK